MDHAPAIGSARATSPHADPMRRIGLILGNRDRTSEAILEGVLDHRRAGADWRVRFLDWPITTMGDLADLPAWRPDGLLCLGLVGGELIESLGVPVVRMRQGPQAAV